MYISWDTDSQHNKNWHSRKSSGWAISQACAYLTTKYSTWIHRNSALTKQQLVHASVLHVEQVVDAESRVEHTSHTAQTVELQDGVCEGGEAGGRQLY